MSYEKLLEPLRIGPLTVANRIVMPPLVIWRSGLDGLVTQAHLDHYARSAGPGLCIVEATAVSPEGRLAATQIGAWSDDHIEGLSRLASIVRAGGAVAGIQIHHAGGRTSHAKNGGLPILVPSRTTESPPEAIELSVEEIARIVRDFGAATRRCLAAGFQVIEIHGAHGYLGSQFLSPATNRRGDEWGGVIADRARFLIECVRTVRAEIARSGHDAVVAVRLGVADGGTPALTVDDGCAAADLLVDAGAELLDVSHGGSPPGTAAVPTSSGRSMTLELARTVRSRVSVPVIGVGGIKTPEQAERAITDGSADLIAVGRAILADQQWAAKTIAGEADRINPCIDCKPRCFHFTEPEKCPPRRLARR